MNMPKTTKDIAIGVGEIKQLERYTKPHSAKPEPTTQRKQKFLACNMHYIIP